MSMKVNILFSGLITLLTVFIQLSVLSALGKEGAELLAYYNIIEISFSIIPAIVLFGGDQYFQFKINQYTSDQEKLKFYFGYVFLSSALFIISLLVVFIYFFVFSFDGYLQAISFISVSISSFFIYLSSYLYRSNFKIIHSSLAERSFYLINGVILLFICLLYKGAVNQDVILFLALIVSSFISIFFFRNMYFLGKKVPRLKIDVIKSFKLIFKDRKGRYFWLTAILIFVYERVDQIFILNVFDYKLLGYYFACYKLSFLPRLFTNIVYSVIYPYLARLLQNSKGEAIRLHDLSFYLTVGIAVTFALPLMFFPESILALMFDESFTEYSGLLKVIVISMVISCVNQINYSLLNANGQGNIIFANAVTSVFVQFVVILSFYETYGLLSIAYARLAVGAVGVIMYIYAMKLINIKLSKLITIVGIYTMLLV